MKVILREDIKAKGYAGDIIEAKPGFARNYLIPQGLAFLATEANMRVYNREKLENAKKVEQHLADANRLKAELEQLSLTAVVKVDEEDHLYGSVSVQTIADLLKEKGHDINHRKIILDTPIKELGVFEATVELFRDVTAQIKVWVVKE